MNRYPLILAALLTLVNGTATAQEDIDAEAYIHYREGLMESAKTHSKSIGYILKGRLATRENIVRHARNLHELSLMIPTAFPEGSDFGETSAKEDIWEDREGFMAAAKKNQQATASLVKAAESGDLAAVGKALGDVGQSCKGCHKKFRARK